MLKRLLYFSGLKAFGADVFFCFFTGPGIADIYFLKVWIPLALGAAHAVGHIHPGFWFFSANYTFSAHNIYSIA